MADIGPCKRTIRSIFSLHDKFNLLVRRFDQTTIYSIYIKMDISLEDAMSHFDILYPVPKTI